jgi:lysophospholipase L1-like esterase
VTNSSSLPHLPQHLSCAVTAASLLLLGTGASCERQSASEPAQQAPSTVPSPAEPPRLAGEPLVAFPNEETVNAPAQNAAPTASAAPPSASIAPIARRPYSIAALGDSLTDYRAGGGGYLRVIAGACPRTVIDNFGKGGDMVNQMRRRFEREILPLVSERGYTHLIVYGGVNDLYSNETAGRTNDLIQRDLAAIYEQARNRGMRVIAMNVSPWGGFSRYFTPYRAETTRQLNRWIEAQQAQGAVDGVIDSYGLLSCGDPERLCPEYAHSDGLHMVARGQEVLGKALLEGVFQDCE